VSQSDGFRGLDLAPTYESKRGRDRDILTSFLVPVLGRAVSFSRTVGYFSSSLLEAAAAGMSRFVYNGGTARLLIGAQVYAHDVDAVTGKIKVDAGFGERLASELVPADEFAQRRLEVLAWLHKEGRLEIRVAVAIDELGTTIVAQPGDPPAPYWHEKVGFFYDKYGEGVSFTGSINDSRQALERNKEHVTVFAAWQVPEHFGAHVREFEEKWEGSVDDFCVMPLPAAVQRKLLTLAPAAPPQRRDALEPKTGKKGLIATVLDLAPRLPNAQALAEETSAVELQPHQRQVHYRLADLYPRSWIVADEVGLGKTVSSGVSLRRLMLAERVKRVLILAPANTCANWQNELFEKFGLWIPRLKDGLLLGAHPSQDRRLRERDNPFLESKALIVSSHLARRARYANLLIDAAAAAPYDLIILDEAHHARKEANDVRKPSNQLLRLLERIHRSQATRALWLLTATPLQMHPLELFVLLRQVGMGRPFDDYATFERYYVELTKGNGANWKWLHDVLSRVERREDHDETAFLKNLRSSLTADNIERIRRFGTVPFGVDETVGHPDFNAPARQAMHRWLRLHGPVERHMTRHSRETLRGYIREGKLDKPLAERDVKSLNIEFRTQERSLYDQLEGFIARLSEVHGNDRQARFVLSIYQRRLTSSWAAIESSLRKRLNNEALVVEDEDDEDGDVSANGAADDDASTIDHVKAVPLTSAETAQLEAYVDQLHKVRDGDSKFAKLETCITEARSTGRRIIVFSQYTDTLDYLREKLVGVYGYCMATYTGEGGRRYSNREWERVSKETLVDLIGAGAVQVLLATDAAAEGLNLQACSYLVNYDMPWNPMRAEQRIGRVDRLGQQRRTVCIRNFFVSELERRVYRALADRIKDFNRFIGGLPPILGVVEKGFIERPLDEQQREPELMDQLPMPAYPPSPVTQEDFVRLVRDELGVTLSPSDPSSVVTWQPDRASRDVESWRAAATYGHPALQAEIRRMAVTDASDAIAWASDEKTGMAVIYRSDRVPPEQLAAIGDLESIGSPVAISEAQRLAEQTIAQRNDEIAGYERQIRRAQHQGGLELFKADYIRLVHEIIALRMGLSLSQQGLQLPADVAWSTFIEENKGGAGVLQYLENLREPLHLSDGRIFAGLDDGVRPVSEPTYYRRLNDREDDARRMFDAWKMLQGQIR
jgi:Helicase conserved C-terminal domain/SNF2-related domain